MPSLLRRRAARTSLALALLTSLAGCMSVPETDTSSAQPRLASYNCGDDGTLRIERAGQMVRVHEVPAASTEPAQGDVEPPAAVELAAAPPGQNSRYGKDGYALVLEEKLALYMKAGRAPYTCQR